MNEDREDDAREGGPRTSIPFDALEIGAEASLSRLCTPDDLAIHAHASGNLNPLHRPAHDGDGDGEPEAHAPAQWLAGLVSAVLGNILPGPGTVIVSQTLRFTGTLHAGEEATARVRLAAKGEDRMARFEVSVASGERTLLEGEVEVRAPERSVPMPADGLAGLTLHRHRHFEALLARAEPLAPIPTAVVAPEEESALGGAMLAARHTLITPILVGHEARIRGVAGAIGASLDGIEIIDVPAHDLAAARAVELVHEGRARAVMKGHLHTDELLRPIVSSKGGLRTGRRLSHVFVMDVPGRDRLLMVTDAAINIAPDLKAKADIAQNAIDLALSLGIAEPKVGVLSAVETVNPAIPSTLEAAALSKMAERGQITGGLVDGPLAMDNAVDLEAARSKGIRSTVAGRADILLAPNIESGNMIAKELTFIAHAQAGGVVVGALVPVILTSRADDDAARLASCAVAALFADWLAKAGDRGAGH